MQTLGFQRLDFFGCGFLSRSDLEWLDAWDPPEWLYSEPDAEAWVRAFWVVLACPKLLQSPRGASPAADHGAWGPRSCLLHLVPTSFLGRVCSCWMFLQNFTACAGRVRSSVGRLARPSGPRCHEPSREARKSLAILGWLSLRSASRSQGLQQRVLERIQGRRHPSVGAGPAGCTAQLLKPMDRRLAGGLVSKARSSLEP